MSRTSSLVGFVAGKTGFLSHFVNHVNSMFQNRVAFASGLSETLKLLFEFRVALLKFVILPAPAESFRVEEAGEEDEATDEADLAEALQIVPWKDCGHPLAYSPPRRFADASITPLMRA